MAEADDKARLEAANKHLANNPEAQLVTLLFSWIATDKPAWLPPETQRVLWPTETRFRWLRERPGVRARIVGELTGVSEKAARLLDREHQTALVDAVLDSGDTPVAAWAEVWEPADLGAHAPPTAVHPKVREAFPWNESPTDDSRRFLTQWVEALLSSGDGNGRARKPILTPLMVRTAIEPKAWQESLPVAVRATVDAARLRAEWKKRPFTAAHELATVTIETVVENLPQSAMKPVLEAAEKGLAGPKRHGTEPSHSSNTEALPAPTGKPPVSAAGNPPPPGQQSGANGQPSKPGKHGKHGKPGKDSTEEVPRA